MIKLRVFRTKENKYAVYVGGISGSSYRLLRFYARRGWAKLNLKSCPDNGNDIRCISERLTKKYDSPDGAYAWIERFNHLPTWDTNGTCQLGIVASKAIRAIEGQEDLIHVKVQYYALKDRHRKTILSSPYRAQLEAIMHESHTIMDTVSKQMTLTRKEYEQVKDTWHMHPFTPKGGRKGELSAPPKRNAVFTNRKS